jgi:hypothetical protein
MKKRVYREYIRSQAAVYYHSKNPNTMSQNYIYFGETDIEHFTDTSKRVALDSGKRFANKRRKN